MLMLILRILSERVSVLRFFLFLSLQTPQKVKHVPSVGRPAPLSRGNIISNKRSGRELTVVFVVVG